MPSMIIGLPVIIRANVLMPDGTLRTDLLGIVVGRVNDTGPIVRIAGGAQVVRLEPEGVEEVPLAEVFPTGTQVIAENMILWSGCMVPAGTRGKVKGIEARKVLVAFGARRARACFPAEIYVTATA